MDSLSTRMLLPCIRHGLDKRSCPRYITSVVRATPIMYASIASDLPLAVEPTDLTDLVALALQAKGEAERQKAIYDSLRDQICAVVRNSNEKTIETTAGKVRLKETKSGWVFSDDVKLRADQLKNMQDIEKRMGIAHATKTTFSADIFPLA